MALVRVRSKQPIDGKKFETEVDETHLERWPDDYEPITEDGKKTRHVMTGPIQTINPDSDF